MPNKDRLTATSLKAKNRQPARPSEGGGFLDLGRRGSGAEVSAHLLFRYYGQEGVAHRHGHRDIGALDGSEA